MSEDSIKLNLSKGEVNILLDAIAAKPLGEVINVFNKIQAQANESIARNITEQNEVEE